MSEKGNMLITLAYLQSGFSARRTAKRQRLLSDRHSAMSKTMPKVSAGIPRRGGAPGHCVNIAVWIESEGVVLCISW